MRYRVALAFLIALSFPGVAGFLSVSELRLVPQMEKSQPAIVANLNWPGSSAEVLESKVVSLLEAGFARCAESGNIFSLTRDQSAFIIVYPDKISGLNDLYEQLVRTLRTLKPFLPEGLQYPALELSGSGSDKLQFPLFTRVWYDLPDSGSSSLMEDFNAAALANGMKIHWSQEEREAEWKLVYDPFKLRDCDITPQEIMDQLARHFSRRTELRMLEGKYSFDLQFGPEKLTGKSLSELTFSSDRMGQLTLGELVEIYPVREKRSSEVRVNGKPALAGDFISDGGTNAWWMSDYFSSVLNGTKSKSLPFFDLDDCGEVFRATVSPLVFFLAMLLTLLFLGVSSRYASVWAGLLFLWFVLLQYGLSLLIFARLTLRIDAGTVQMLIQLQTLNLVPLFLSVVEPVKHAKILRKVNLIYISALLVIGFSGISLTKSHENADMVLHRAVLIQTLILGLNLWIAQSIFSLISSKSQMDKNSVPFWIWERRCLGLLLKSLALVVFFLLLTNQRLVGFEKPGYDQNDDLMGELLLLISGSLYLKAPKIKSAGPPTTFGINLFPNPMISNGFTENWLFDLEEKILENLSPSENLILTRISRDRVSINILDENGFGANRFNAWKKWAESLAEFHSDIDVRMQFDDLNSNENSLQKTLSYKLKIAGFDLFTLNNWTNTLIKKLSQNPRISYVGIVDPEKRLWENSSRYVELEKMPVTEQLVLRRSLNYFSQAALYNPNLGISLHPGRVLPFDKYLSTEVPDDERQVIIRSDQQYVNEVEFDFIGSRQSGEALLKENLGWIRQRLPAGFSALIPEKGIDQGSSDKPFFLPNVLLGILIVLFSAPAKPIYWIRLILAFLFFVLIGLACLLISPFQMDGTGSGGFGMILIWTIYLLGSQMNGFSVEGFSYLLFSWVAAAMTYVLVSQYSSKGFISGWVFLSSGLSLALFIWVRTIKLIDPC